MEFEKKTMAANPATVWYGLEQMPSHMGSSTFADTLGAADFINLLNFFYC